MPAMTLPKGSILKVATFALPNTKFALTEHNRAQVNVTFERIEGETDRMANGRLRKWFVADKHSWDTSWDMVPHNSTYTLDGGYGGQEIEAFHLANPGEFYLYVRKPDGTEEQFLVVVSNFSRGVQKRGIYEFWNITITFEEV